MSQAPPPELPPSRRRDARERALELLYEADMKGLRISALLPELPMAPDAYAEAIVTGVDLHQSEHDQVIQRLLRADWSFDRLAVLDRLLLRMGCEELAHQPGTPTAVILDETVELAKLFCAEESSRFVNGVLAKAANELRPGEKTRTRSKTPKPARDHDEVAHAEVAHAEVAHAEVAQDGVPQDGVAQDGVAHDGVQDQSPS